MDKQGFSPFGKVIEGMDIVDAIYAGYGGDPDQGGAVYQLSQLTQTPGFNPWNLKCDFLVSQYVA